ncbi:MAG TPA: 3-dehydroquinate synthase [Gammaproteobacteria bacterium]|jgi:3-dehydroquinate synthase|nr:3-dehydroquinate synthase [Gammaproteobacteria bacterium]MDP7153783.1 3-dehydroquinate synthase [Gammaproteobacteria bacterium]MDP7295966.1 3-dehydroquinate synthase [Gammaproteobacteria bacterium]MDP7661088.1 3-dehydroquinate synthase [Gammaproteobacteria bacterium]HJP37627.1 3-dehydroquinate synthase [Gammaproteobacteria bacterium]
MSELSEQIVNLGERSYPILIGSGLLKQDGILDPFVGDADVFVVTNDVVGPLYLKMLNALLGTRRIDSIELPDGEVHKTIASFESILDRLVAGRFARDALLITLGGGVVGDIGGFAAAAYQRGIRFIQVPTTLLAQVDSAVGGKTAVNHPGGKNLIGAFHQPSAVLIDTDTLVTLPDRELRAGLAEIVKYGLIVDAEFFAWLEVHAAELLAREPAALHHAIRRSCQLKAAIVAEDEREAGRRALLNLGHTYGHAIERCAGYGAWLHGEAVAAGICMAAEFSARLGYLESGDTGRISALFTALALPTGAPKLGVDDFMAAMSIDKKVVAGEIRLVLLHSIGSAEVTADYPSAELAALLAEQLVR